MTDTRCPHCGRRLPRQYHFVSPSHGRDTVAGVIMLVSGYGGLFFVVFHLGWPDDLYRWPLYKVAGTTNLVIGAVMFGVYLAIEGLLVSTYLWWWERHNPSPERDNVTYSYDHETRLGDGIRAVTTQDGHRWWLRERGFVVPPEPERGALSRWLWAVHDGRVTFSQRGARATLTDNAQTRQWASDVLALWCKAGWATPASGWLGDEPDLSQGVINEDEDVVAACASGGYSAMIALLVELVEESVSPHSERESASPTGGLPPAPPTAIGDGGSGEGGDGYQLEPLPWDGDDD